MNTTFKTTPLININKIIKNKFSSSGPSAKLYSSNKNKEDIKEKIIKLTKEDELNLREGLDKISEMSTEASKLEKYLIDNPTDISSIEECFPKLVSVNENLPKEETKPIFDITKQVIDEFKICIQNGSINENCVDKIKLSKIIIKAALKLAETSDEQINETEVISDLVKNELENSGVLQKIGDITLRDIYEMCKKTDDNLCLRIHPNYKEIGLSLISYGILLNNYNKYVHNRPIPTNLSVEDIRVIKTTKSISRYWFAGLVAPLLIFSFHKIRSSNSNKLMKVDININKETDVNKSTELNSGLFLLLSKIVKNQSGKLNSFSIFIIMVLFIFLIIMFWYLDGMNLINNISVLKNIIYVDYLKYILFIVILLPLILNSLIYYLLIKVEKTGKINSLVVDKYLPNILLTKRFFDYINYLEKNKELLNYYKASSKADLYFYICILILYLYLFNFLSL